MKIPRILSIMSIVARFADVARLRGRFRRRYKIGVISPLTGDVAVYGNAVYEAVQLYVEQLTKPAASAARRLSHCLRRQR